MTTYTIICQSLYFSDDSVKWHLEVPSSESVAEVDEVKKEVKIGKKIYPLEDIDTGLSGTCVAIGYRTTDFFGDPMSVKAYTETPTEGNTLGDILVAARYAMKKNR